RQRALEIESLAMVFVAEASRRSARPVVAISPPAVDLLRHYSWPGNVRELRNVMERAVVLCSDDLITPEHLPVEKMGEMVAIHLSRRTGRPTEVPPPELAPSSSRPT